MITKELLSPPKTIAVVGLSDKPDRPSYDVASYLIEQGFTIIPVNPMIESVFGLKSYPSISDIPSPEKIDIVDIFRRSEDVLPIIEEIIKLGIHPFIWMQERVISLEAEKLAQDNNMEVVMDICIKKQHRALNR